MLTLFALPSARVCIAWDGERPVGFAAARIAAPESELLLIAVVPTWRGRGIGGCCAGLATLSDSAKMP